MGPLRLVLEPPGCPSKRAHRQGARGHPRTSPNLEKTSKKNRLLFGGSFLCGVVPDHFSHKRSTPGMLRAMEAASHLSDGWLHFSTIREDSHPGFPKSPHSRSWAAQHESPSWEPWYCSPSSCSCQHCPAKVTYLFTSQSSTTLSQCKVGKKQPSTTSNQ